MSELTHENAYRLIYQAHLSDSERAALQHHLRSCPSCRMNAVVFNVLENHLWLGELPTRPSPQFTAVYRESAARRSRRSRIMKPVYAVGGAAALVMLMLAGWFIVRSNIQTAGLVEAPKLPDLSVSEVQATPLPAAPEAAAAKPTIDLLPDIEIAAVDQTLIDAVNAGAAAEAARSLDEGANPDLVQLSGYPILKTAVMEAIDSGDYEIVQLLLDRGADANQLDGSGNAILPLAAGAGKLELAQILLDAGADASGTMSFNVEDIDLLKQAPAIMHAASSNNPDLVKLLIEHGADPNQTEAGGYRTALHVAAVLDRPAIIEMLLQNGADPDPPGSRTPLHFASEYQKVRSVQALLAGGADPNAQTSTQGKTALIYAVTWGPAQGSTVTVRVLLENGADPDQVDSNGSTVLHHAVKARKEAVIPILIEFGASIDAQDSTGSTALHLAAQSGRTQMAAALVELGASLDLTNNEGQTPLDVAANDRIIELLREAGAAD